MILLLAFIFGASLASFIGVVAGRLYVAPIVNARSKCLTCSHILGWKDMIPMVSCLLLRGRCRYCKTKFGYTHAIFEFVFGLFFMLLVKKYIVFFDSSHLLLLKDFFFQVIILMIFGVIFLFDLRHKIIPRFFLYMFLLFSLYPLLSLYFSTHDNSVFFAPLFVALPYATLFLLTLGRGVGFGDVLLYAGCGAILATDGGLLLFLVSLWLGTLTVIPLIFFKKLTKKSAIPFAPFIIVSYYFVLFTTYTVSDLISFLYHAML